jgi:hypothetical protein
LVSKFARVDINNVVNFETTALATESYAVEALLGAPP